MKTMHLVNEKVLVTFLCSMVSLLALSSILSHIDTNEDTSKAVASVNEVTIKKDKEELKVDMVEVYSKNDILTPEPVIEEPVVETTPVTYTPAVVTGSVADYQAYAYSQFGNYGWTEEDFNSLVQLWNRESGWNPNSHNSRSGAHGIPQALPASKMAAYGDDYMTNYVPQINWGLNYISARYGNPTNAYNNLLTKGWY